MVDKGQYKPLVKASLMAIGVDIILMSLKYGLAVLTGNAIFIADAFHSLGDFAISFTVLLSIVINKKFADRSCIKYIEIVISLLIALVLITGSIIVIVESVFIKVTDFILKPGIPMILAFLGVSIACALTLGMSFYKSEIGSKYRSVIFFSEGKHTYSDFFTTFSVWLTIILGYLGIHIERITASIMGIVVFQIGLKLINDIFHLYGEHSLLKKISTRRIGRGIIFLTNKVKPLIKFFKIPYPEMEWFIVHKKGLVLINAMLILLMYIGLGFYTVLPYQTGVELFLGEVRELNPPGLHYHLPVPFGTAINVNTGVSIRLESGFRTNWAEDVHEPDIYLWELSKADGRYIKNLNESIALTGDENLIDGNFLCYYRITDPVHYALNCGNARELLRSIFTYEVHAVLGKYPLEPMLTNYRGLIQKELTENMILAVDKLYLGVEILSVYMQEVHPPVEVVSSYRAVASAREKKDETIHLANAYTNKLIPRSRGRSTKLIYEAEADAFSKEKAALSETKVFDLRAVEFNKYPAAHRVALWWDRLEKALINKHIYVFPSNTKRRFYILEDSTSSSNDLNPEESSQ